jgi:Leucine-rich repeat (LRR) protein
MMCRNLDSNRLTGTIPSQLAQLTRLTTLYLSNNQLKGTLPEQLAELTGLTDVHLESNQLKGTMPEQLAELTRLTEFNLYNNHLTGVVPGLPFKQITKNCCLYYSQRTNNFTCPLPADAVDCKCNGQPGVPVCNSGMQ